MQTTVEFLLPVGLAARDGRMLRDGVMRLATARDEIEPLRNPEVRRNDAYLSVLLLARTVTRIGDVVDITPGVIEGLYAADFDYLQRLYERINTDGDTVGVVECPACNERFEVRLPDIEDGRLGE